MNAEQTKEILLIKKDIDRIFEEIFIIYAHIKKLAKQSTDDEIEILKLKERTND